MRQQHRQQHQQQQNSNREYDNTSNISALRAATEAVTIGRETLNVLAQQTEQLTNADDMVDETSMKLDKANRILRGMTWQGWTMNIFSKKQNGTHMITSDGGGGGGSGGDTTTEAEKSQQQQQEKQRNKIPDLESYSFFDDGTTINDGDNNNDHRNQSIMPSWISSSNQQKQYEIAIQSLKNYHCNLIVLFSCETFEQYDTCKLICQDMFFRASNEVQILQQLQQLEQRESMNNDSKNGTELHNGNTTNTNPRQQEQQQKNNIDQQNPSVSGSTNNDKIVELITRLQSDLSLLRNRQLTYQYKHTNDNKNNGSGNNQSRSTAIATNVAKTVLFDGKFSSPQNNDNNNHNMKVFQEQEEHLNNLSNNLGELNDVAQLIGLANSQQVGLIDSIQYKSENVHEQARMVSRRTDRMIQHKKAASWINPFSKRAKYNFEGFVKIRHNKTNKYVGVDPHSPQNIILTTKFHPLCGCFGYYKKQGQIGTDKLYSLKNRFSDKYLGQALIGGYLTCSSSSCGQREEWEVRYYYYFNIYSLYLLRLFVYTCLCVYIYTATTACKFLSFGIYRS